MGEQRHLLLKSNTINTNSNESEVEDDEEWSESSSNDSYYSDSDSSVPEWESSVDENTGELLYIDCHPFVIQNNVETANKQKDNSESFSKNKNSRRSTRGKFLRLIRRRDSKRRSRRYQKAHQDNNELISTSNKVKFQDFQEGEEKEVILKIISNDHSRKINTESKNVIELLLGLNISTLSDGNRIMIAGFLPDSEAKYEKNIKIGDWLKSINNINVTYQNINNVLQQFADKKDVLLKLQRVAGVDVTKDPPINELNCQSRFVKQLINSSNEDKQILHEIFCKNPLGILYLNTENLIESGPEFQDVVYCYPQPLQKNLLSNSRGIFLTLTQLVDDITSNKPRISSILFKEDTLAYVVYNIFNNKKLLLLMLPDNSVGVGKEIIFINNELVRMLEFLYETLDKCFITDSNQLQLNNFFDQFFTRLLNNGQWICIDNFIELYKSSQTNPIIQFEQLLPVAATLNLPSEAYMQIDDALTELEASDYREWNEEPLDCQRLFTILGSALYHAGYLLASHLIHEDLIDVHCFCRQQGLFHLSKTEPVKTLVLWREVFPYSCSRAQKTKFPIGRRYLLVVGSSKNLLAVVMEAGGCTEPALNNMGPDAFYVEEAQATLAHIQELGIPELADKWLGLNPGPQVTVPEYNTKRKPDFIGIKSTSHQLLFQKKPSEVTSILKRRNSDQLLNHSNSLFSLPDESCELNSEDSGSQRSDRNRSKYDSNDDDSDGDDNGDGSQMSNSSFDLSELRQTFLSETEDIQPQQLTAGIENVLFHFLQLDCAEGILLCPPESRLKSETLDVILNNFRKCCHKIHFLFQNTLRFKNMPAQEIAKSVMNKSLIAIKEHGVKFECQFLDEADNKKNKINFWVIGRLFYMPHPREVYVCYQDTIPQNIIELAFKINLSAII